MNSQFEERINKLRKSLDVSNEGIVLTNEVNIGYFCGFFHSEGVMLITMNEAYLFVDFRYKEAAQNKAKACKVICFNKFYDELTNVIHNNNVNSLYFELSNISVARFNLFKNKLESKNIECLESNKIDSVISEIRIIKTQDEINCIQKAQQITEKSYLEVLNYLKPGVTEKQISARLEFLMKQNGAEDISFDLITITGSKTSLPHGVPSDDFVKEGDFFTFDIGAIYNGYHSDTTRTVAIGYATDEMTGVYNIVLEAQQKALKQIKAGILCSEVDFAARSVIENYGYGKYFGHATGHGVGLDIHEMPTVSYRSDTVLKAGMIITDEPGIYLPNKFGVRIEDMVLVTENGHKNFVSLPKELIVI